MKSIVFFFLCDYLSTIAFESEEDEIKSGKKVIVSKQYTGLIEILFLMIKKLLCINTKIM